MNTKIRQKYKEDIYGRLTRTQQSEIKNKKRKKEGVKIRKTFKQKKCR